MKEEPFRPGAKREKRFDHDDRKRVSRKWIDSRGQKYVQMVNGQIIREENI